MGFNSVFKGLMVGKAAVGQGFLRLFRFFRVTTIQGRVVHNGCMTEAMPEILGNFKM